VNVGSEVVIQAILPKWSMDYTLTAEARRGSQMDPVVALYDTAGNRLVISNDISPTDSSSKVTFGLTADSRYSIAATRYDAATTGAYSICVAAALGDLDTRLLDRSGHPIAQSDGVTDRETLLLGGHPAGRYYLEVSGEGGTGAGYTV